MALNKERILSVLLAATLVTGLAPATSYATPGDGEDDETSSAAKTAPESTEDADGTEGLRLSVGDPAENDGDADADGSERVTIIVQLEDDGAQGISLFGGLLGESQQDRHAYFKDQVRELAQEAQPAAEGPSSRSASADAIEELHDYYHVIDGFAVKAPASTLEDIKELDGVKNAFVEQSYAVPTDQGSSASATESALKNQNALEATGADQVDVKGDGQVVAIIDTGLDTDHEAFSGDLNDAAVALSSADVDSLKAELTGSGGAYVSEKIPFAYDYADGDSDVNPGLAGLEHGTHVAGIAAANGGDQIRGTAPNAQIVAMKVASDASGAMYDSTILAAIDDCGVILPDSVNISLGSDAGFSDEGNATFADAIGALEDAGVTVNVAAGNAYSSAYANQSGENLPYAEDPDSSVISTPASVSSSLAVASVGADPVEVSDGGQANVITASDGTEMRYWEAAGPDGEVRPKKFADSAEGNYEVVWGDAMKTSGQLVCGELEIEGDAPVANQLEGKIVLIYGHADPTGASVISYARALSEANDLGAEAVIIYDPELTEEQLAEVQIAGGVDAGNYADGYYDENDVPCIFVTAEDGEKLKGIEKDERAITVKHESAGEGTTSHYQVSAYSSWGVTNDLKLKPEVAAPGGNVYSSIPNGGYQYMSGTSMATPQMTGITALMHEYVEQDEKFAGMSASEKTAVVTQLLMNTATPLADTDDLSSYYSPRQQGAGLVNVADATTSDVYATVEGAENASRPKADVGESTEGTWSFTVTLHNLGSTDRTFAFDAAALSDTVANGLFQQQSKNWTGQGISVSCSAGNEVSVPAGETASCTVIIACEEAFKSFAAANTSNGTFVDGFALFNATDGGVDLSVPFMGFYGDWSAASVFDDAIDEDYHIYGTSLVDAQSGDYLGVNPLDDSARSDASKVDLDKVVLSASSYAYAPTSLTTKTGLLRNVDSLKYEVIEGGESIGEAEYAYVPKTTWNATYGTFVNAESTSPFQNGAPVLSGANGEETVTLKQTATTSGPTPESQEQSFDIQYDLTGPSIESVRYDDNNGAPTLTFTVEDNTYLAAIDFVNPEITGVTPYAGFHRVLVDPDEALKETKEDGTKVYEVTVSVADIKGAWNEDGAMPNIVSAYAWDYGMNPSGGAEAVVNPVPATSVAIDAETVSIAPGQQVPLTATIEPADATENDLVWSVGDEKIATIDASGTITGVAEGSTTVTVAVADRPELSNTVEVSVARVSDAEGIRLSSATKRVVTDNTVGVEALLSDSLQGKTVTWSTSDGEVASVEPVADDSSKALVTGEYQVADTTLTASVTGDDGTVYTATMTVQNRTADYDDFVIDENGVLTKYVGVKSAIEIPNNVTEIADRLFYGNASVRSVTIPASVKRIGAEAFAKHYQDNGSSVTITGESKTLTFEDTEEHPSQLVEVGEHAFADGGVEGSISFPDSVTTFGDGVFSGNLAIKSVRLSDNLTVIPDGTFEQCATMEYVAISDKVTSIGTSAFKNCLFLENIDIIGKDVPEGQIGLPSALEEMGDSAFASTYLYGEVVLPSGVKRVESSAFALNSYIYGVTLNEGLQSIGQNAFQQTSISSLTLPDSVTELDWHALFGMLSLEELTLSKNLGDGELAGAIGTYASPFTPDGMNITKINVPEDALYYSEKDGAVFNKNQTTLVYYPAGLTGDYAVPEGVTTIAQGVFDDSHLSSITFPASLETIEASGVAKQLDTVDLGENIVSIEANAFKQEFYANDASNSGYTPQHLIVRGGDNGSYADTVNAQNDQTAYFGQGMTTLSFANSGAPSTLVVPADLASLDLSGNEADPGSVTVYAPADSAGWSVAQAELERIGADPSTQLKPYENLEARYDVTGISGNDISVQAKSVGGVGGVWYRFVQANADGTQKVLQDWGETSTYTWTMPAEKNASLLIEVRDTTELTARTAFGPEAPVIEKNLSTEPITVGVGGEAPVLSIEATSVDGATLSYQWYCDGKAIEGATAASYTPAVDVAGTHTYHCVVSATKDGLTTAVASAKATVVVGTAAQAPVIKTDLPAETTVAEGAAVMLRVEATSPDGGTLSYQWYCDGEAIEGATSSSYAPDTTQAGTHEYYVAVTNTTTMGGEATTATVNSATARVTVTAAVQPGGDKAALQSFVDKVSGLTADGYTVESWAAFESALVAAQNVLAKDGATQSEINEALSNLQKAHGDLKRVQVDHTQLADGSYDVQVSMLSALDVRGESMASPVLEPDATLAVEDGAYTLSIALKQGATVMGYAAYLSDLSFYPDGYTVSENYSVVQKGSPSAATVDEVTADGYPAKVSVPLNDQAKTEGGTLMYGTFAEMGSQFFVVSIDWDAFDDQYGPEEPPAVVVDKAKLAAALAEAANATMGDSAVDYAVLQQAVKAAQAVFDDADATQAEVDAAANELTEALDRFNDIAGFAFQAGGVYRMPTSWVNADGTALALGFFSAVAQVNALEDGYEVLLTTTVDSDAYIGNVTYGENDTPAELVSETREAGTRQFRLTVDSLTDAVKVSYDFSLGDSTYRQSGYLLLDTTLVQVVSEPEAPAPVDKTALNEVIASALALERGDKTDAAWKALQDAIAAAQSVASDAEATQDEADAAAAALQEAVEAFKASADDPAVDAVDKAALREAVDKAAQLTQGSKSNEAWSALQTAIAAARAVLGDEDAAQADVDAAVAALEEAVSAFNASADVEDGSGEQGGSGSGSGSGAGSGSGSDGSGGSGAGSGGAATGSGSAANGSLVQTGDALPIVSVLATAVLAGIAAAIAFVRRRKAN